ncbi:MAG: hypothetical protein WBA93_19920 [Microcoleaceae cyanobacterium]
MTIYFKQNDWDKVKILLHQAQKLTDENSELGIIIDESLDILNSQDADDAAEESYQELQIKANKQTKGGAWIV